VWHRLLDPMIAVLTQYWCVMDRQTHNDRIYCAIIASRAFSALTLSNDQWALVLSGW